MLHNATSVAGSNRARSGIVAERNSIGFLDAASKKLNNIKTDSYLGLLEWHSSWKSASTSVIAKISTIQHGCDVMVEQHYSGKPDAGEKDSEAVAVFAAAVSRPALIFITRTPRLGESVIDYIVAIADRLGLRIVAVFVDTLPHRQQNCLLTRRMTRSATCLEEKARARGLDVSAVRESGRLAAVVRRLCHTVKRVEFVLLDQGIAREPIASVSPVPVFSVLSTGPAAGDVDMNEHALLFPGEKPMTTTQKKRHVVRTLTFGAATAGLYGAMFAFPDTVMHYWTKGGVYALLPVATVFLFSYIHGSFTSNFWSALGIEGSKAAAKKQVEKRSGVADTTRKRPDTRPRLRAQ